MHKLLTTLFVTLAAGCAASKPPYVLPIDTTYRIQINAQFDSLANATRVQIQDGKRSRDRNLDRWTTYCELFVYNKKRKADYVTSVSPGEFEIVRVDARYDSVDYLDRPWGRYSSLLRGRHDPPAFYLYRVGMRLTSADQPDVRSLNCYKKWATRGRYYPTLVEIRAALGDLIEIRPLAISN